MAGHKRKAEKRWLTFRRTYSSWSHDQGVPGKVAAQLMGHAKVLLCLVVIGLMTASDTAAQTPLDARLAPCLGYITERLADLHRIHTAEGIEGRTGQTEPCPIACHCRCA